MILLITLPDEQILYYLQIIQGKFDGSDGLVRGCTATAQGYESHIEDCTVAGAEKVVDGVTYSVSCCDGELCNSAPGGLYMKTQTAIFASLVGLLAYLLMMWAQSRICTEVSTLNPVPTASLRVVLYFKFNIILCDFLPSSFVSVIWHSKMKSKQRRSSFMMLKSLMLTRVPNKCTTCINYILHVY